MAPLGGWSAEMRCLLREQCWKFAEVIQIFRLSQDTELFMKLAVKGRLYPEISTLR